MDCLFCKIINGDIPSSKIYEDDKVLVFKDINPIAPTHWLIIPKSHLTSVSDVTAENSNLVGYIFEVASKLAKENNIESYRIITNCGDDAGQTVKHLHFHFLAGAKMGWSIE